MILKRDPDGAPVGVVATGAELAGLQADLAVMLYAKRRPTTTRALRGYCPYLMKLNDLCREAAGLETLP